MRTGGEPLAHRAVNRERLLKRLAQGAVQNVAFRDLVQLIEGFGFLLIRTSGSHHVYATRRWPSLSISRTRLAKRSRIRFGSSFGWWSAINLNWSSDDD